MRIGERIKGLLSASGKRRSELARHLDVSVQAVAGWLVGGSDPLPSKRAKIAEFFGISEEELLFGPAHRSSPRAVRIIRWDEATYPQSVVDNELSGFFPATFQVSIPLKKHTFALVVQGESMINPAGFPSFPPGTVIAAEPEEQPEPGDYVLARVSGLTDVAFGQLVIETGKRYLKPLNPRYPLTELAANDDVIAVVLEYGARLKG